MKTKPKAEVLFDVVLPASLCPVNDYIQGLVDLTMARVHKARPNQATVYKVRTASQTIKAVMNANVPNLAQFLVQRLVNPFGAKAQKWVCECQQHGRQLALTDEHWSQCAAMLEKLASRINTKANAIKDTVATANLLKRERMRPFQQQCLRDLHQEEMRRLHKRKLVSGLSPNDVDHRPTATLLRKLNVQLGKAKIAVIEIATQRGKQNRQAGQRPTNADPHANQEAVPPARAQAQNASNVSRSESQQSRAAARNPSDN